MTRARDLLVDSRIALARWTMRLPSATVRLALARTLLRWEVGTGCVIGRHTTFLDLGGVRLGDRVNLGHHATLDGRGGLRIGSDVDIAPGATVLTADHDPDSPDFAGRTRAVVIGDRCWLATGAVVLPGAVLEDGVVLGAGAVARGRLERDGIYTGNPAVLVRHRAAGAQRVLGRYARFWL